VSLNRRRLEKLEAKRSKVKPVPDELLEAYYMALEDYQAELEGRPPPYPDPPDEDHGDS